MMKYPEPKEGVLTIRDLDFKISSAVLKERESEGRRLWTVYIGTEEREILTPDLNPPIPMTWAPNIRGEDAPVKAPPHDNIIGKTVQVPHAYNRGTGEYIFSMYIFSHEDVYDSKITFLNRRDSEDLISWTGKCNVGYNAEYGDGVPFSLKTWIKRS